MKCISACFLLMLAWGITVLDAQQAGGRSGRDTTGRTSSQTTGNTGRTSSQTTRNTSRTSSQTTEDQNAQLVRDESAAGKKMTPSAQLALSSPDYMVTTGDVYTLAYLAGTTPVEYTITVDSSYRIRVSNLGVIDGAGKTFNQLKTQVETIVLNNYPLGAAQLVIREPALFKIYIKGEVQETQEMQAWALLRLSTVLEEDILTQYSSMRNIQIRSSNGQVRTYDLFMASRAGDLSQNPFVRPDDIITVNRIDRQVTIEGAVERPGTYELLRGENLKQLIEVYGYGLTLLADTTRMELTRYTDRASLTGDQISLEGSDITNDFALKNQDNVIIPEITMFRPSFFVEGAVDIKETELATSNHLVIDFVIGDTYGALLRRSESWFSAVSDTQNAYILRDGVRIPLNINPLLYDVNYQNDTEIREGDMLVIPFRQYFVSVAGAVYNPGRYPYIPDRGWDYYIGLAGGFTENNSNSAITLIDMNGKTMNQSDPITPETTITARSNSGLYYFNRVAPIITTILSIISTTFTVIAAFGGFR
jgi:protein involved in polysaccharide export with SLBB domain